jgi:hypothetical protein
MKTSILIILALFVSVQFFGQAANGEIHGKVFDEFNLPIEGVIIEASAGSTAIKALSDSSGRFRIKPLLPGTYSVRLTMNLMSEVKIEGVMVNPDKITHLKDTYMEAYNASKPVVVFAYKDPLIHKDGETVVTIRAKELNQMSVSNGGNLKAIVLSLSSDIKSSPDGEELYFRGSRSGSVIYMLDGVKIRENVPNVPSSGISSMSVYTGGLPAKYGDTTGGVVVIETKSYLEDYYEKLNRK